MRPAKATALGFLILAGLLALAGCASQRITTRAQAGSWYDYNTLRVSEEAEIFQKGYGSYLMHCEGSFLDEEGEAYKFHIRGIVSPIEIKGKTYFLGAGHVFDLEKEIILRGGSSTASKVRPPVYYLELNGNRYEMDKVDRGNRDLALFVQRGTRNDFPRSRYHCGNSDDLRMGNPVLSWGMPLLEDFELSIGIVSALSAPKSLREASFPESAAEDFFVTSMTSIFGCSGALVYAFRDGNPEIVGMLVAGYININRSMVYKINSILRDSGLDR